MCDYFLRCDRYPNGMVEHPVLGRVPTCTRCAEKMEQELLPFTFEEAESMLAWIEANDSNTYGEVVVKASDEMKDTALHDSNVTLDEWMVHIIRNDNAEVLS